MSKPIVAIIGRQNVGKSTLLNRLAGRRLAIVEDLPGTTRDRVFADASWRGREFAIIDTGGLQPEGGSDMAREVNEQVATAIAEADAVIYLADARDGIMPGDRDIADRLRRLEKPMLLAVNKVDSDRYEATVAEFYQLGLGEPLPISAYHGRGTAEMLDKLVEVLPTPPPEETKPDLLKIAIVGRPNVGKSMLLNAVLGNERVIVDATAGTTRDAIDTWLDFHGQNVLLIDTAGIRRRGHIEGGIERYSVIRSLRAIDRSDVSLLVMDASEPLSAQDAHVAGFIQRAERGVVLVVNKWDLVKEKDTSQYDKHIRSKLKFFTHAPVLYVSALTGQGVDAVVPVAHEVYQERIKRISTARVNKVVQEALADHTQLRAGARPLRVLYATQVDVSPPTFAFFVNDATAVHFSFKRYLENRLRAAFGFRGTPIRMVFKSKGEK